jgi:hypothetical protein
MGRPRDGCVKEHARRISRAGAHQTKSCPDDPVTSFLCSLLNRSVQSPHVMPRRRCPSSGLRSCRISISFGKLDPRCRRSLRSAIQGADSNRSRGDGVPVGVRTPQITLRRMLSGLRAECGQDHLVVSDRYRLMVNFQQRHQSSQRRML